MTAIVALVEVVKGGAAPAGEALAGWLRAA